ncbi:DEAD/DEAH box helicase family protein [Ruminococcus sp. NK3A76]|uniref:DEAD/DEAH box helicase family protein n=1 Tax=Ruminococcus sp. NK3A76 TaxID=877411 RepID=UPI000490D980|nr:DEAD/DEAH box helicase family protein [Ruminococcus sp. NK3A76]
MWGTKENSVSFDDFESQKVVLISDEAHHLNVDTKKKLSSEEEDNRKSWEYTVNKIFGCNRDNILLEFTATCDLENNNIKAAYENNACYFCCAMAHFFSPERFFPLRLSMLCHRIWSDSDLSPTPLWSAVIFAHAPA